MKSGYVDKLDHGCVEGWVWNPSDPSERVEVEIFDGDVRLARVRADRPRADLARAKVGDGQYGFAVRFPPDLFPLAAHRLSVRFADTDQDLKNSPQLIHPPKGGSLENLSEWFGGRVDEIARAAIEPGQLAPLFSVCMNALSRLMEAEYRLLEQKSITPEAIVPDENIPARLKYVLERAQATLKPLHVPGFPKPGLSIIVAAEAGLAETHALIRSIVTGARMKDYEIILVDAAGGTDLAVLPFLVKGSGLRIVKTATRLPLLRAYALGLAQARGEDLIFLGGIAELEGESVVALRDTLAFLGDQAIVGARLTSRDGRIVEAGSRLEAFGQRVGIGRYDGSDAPRHRILKSSDDVSPHGFAIRRDALQSLGGFDGTERYGALGMADLCLRLREAGGTVRMQGYAGATVSESEGVAPPMQGFERAQFVRRWAHLLPSPGAQPKPAALTRKRALVIDELWPDPARDAASMAVVSHAESLLRSGYQVEFLSTETGGGTAADAYRLSIRGIVPVLGQENVPAFLEAREDQFEVVYLHRFVTARDHMAISRATQPRARIVYNVADLHYLRLRRQAETEGREELLGESEIVEQIELAGIAAADAIITHSREEQKIIRAGVPAAQVFPVLWSQPHAGRARPWDERSDIVFLGSYSHAPNSDAVVAFAERVWHRIRLQAEGARLEVAGSHVEKANFPDLGEGVVLRGYVADIASYLGQRRLMVAPLRFGAGVKGKVLLALSLGLPCIMSPIAAEGLDFSDELAEMLVAADDRAFVEKAVRLYNDAEAWKTASALGRAFADANLSPAAIDRQMAEVLAIPAR